MQHPEMQPREELEQMDRSDLIRALMLAQAQLDSVRRIPLGRYAFYHRHLAMGYVRKRDPDLANWASVEAGHQIDTEGGKSFEDVVERLEVERDKARDALQTIENLYPDVAEIVERALS